MSGICESRLAETRFDWVDFQDRIDHWNQRSKFRPFRGLGPHAPNRGTSWRSSLGSNRKPAPPPAEPFFGCAAVEARTWDEIKAAFSKALNADGPTVIATPVNRQLRPLTRPLPRPSKGRSPEARAI